MTFAADIKSPGPLRRARGRVNRLVTPVRRTVGRLVGPSPFPPDVRLTWAMSGGEGEGFWGRCRMLSRCLREPTGGEPYYRVGGRTYYFHPGFDVDETGLREGVELVLREAYLDDDADPSEVRPRPGETVLDLGGNIGTLAMRYAQAVGGRGRVYSFEPVVPGPLRRNLKANFVGNVTVVEKAVGDAPGRIEFAVHDNCIDSRHDAADTAEQPVVARVEVEVVRLDDWCAAEGVTPDVVKLDVEGAEEPALRGGERTLRERRPRLTIASYHLDAAGDPQHPKLARLLRKWGYTVRERPGGTDADGNRVGEHIWAW